MESGISGDTPDKAGKKKTEEGGKLATHSFSREEECEMEREREEEKESRGRVVKVGVTISLCPLPPL